MKISKNSMIQAAVFYACSVVISEMTLGNPEFPISVWRFVTIPAWQWSLPVHAAGFIWIFLCNNRFYDHGMRVPIVVSTLFFLVCETANWSMFHFFIYEPYPMGDRFHLGAAGSFWFIILLYTVLCTVTSFLLRTSGIFNLNQSE